MNLTPSEKQHGKWYLLIKRIKEPIVISTRAEVIRLAASGEISDFIKIDAPPNRFYADPFCVKHQDKHYIFFEELEFTNRVEDAGRGWNSYIVLNADDSYEGPFKIDMPQAPHMSFPYIFSQGDQLYMVPETCHLKKINLYRCAVFPHKWELVKTLINDIHAGDSQLLFHNGLWYMFSYVLDEKHTHDYKFHIYYAEDLLGPWHSHEIVNEQQIMHDNVKLTRGAGQIYIDAEGRIIRPAQMSNKGINGEAVILYHVKCLTKNTFHEVPLTIINKNNLGVGRSIHTFSLYTDIVVMDARDERPGIDQPFVPFTQPKDNNIIMDNNFYVNHDILKQAFSINTSGNGKCYYGITLDGHTYPGERNWDARWDLIKDCIDWTGKSVLDIGCNMGITLSYLKKFRNVENTMGIEATDEFLQKTDKPRTIEALRLLEDAFGLSNDRAGIIQMDLNSKELNEKIEADKLIKFDPNIICIAMSILKWIDDKETFMKLISRFNTIIYEGHESDEEELARFAAYGFTGKILGKTQTGASYPDDDTRTLILFTK